MFKRVVIKISGEALGNDENNFNNEIISRITKEIKFLINNGVEVSIVVGGGNFWRGRTADQNMDAVSADQIGMLATVMNGIYLNDFFRQEKLQSVVMTPFSLNLFTEKFSKCKALEYIKQKNILIFAGGIGHPFFSTDTVVSLRASEIEAEAILFAKNIDGVYDSDPKKNSNAKKYKTIGYNQVMSKSLDVADISAVQLASKSNIESVVFSLKEKDSIIIACRNNSDIFEIGGTKISNNFEEEFYV